MKKSLFFIACFISSMQLFSQGIIKGKIIDSKSRAALPFVSILIIDTEKGTTTDNNGAFVIENSPLGYVKIQASFIGYKTVISESYLVTNDKSPYIVIELTETASKLDEVVIQTRLFKKSVTSPLSKQSLGIVEIEKNPGGNRDLSLIHI